VDKLLYLALEQCYELVGVLPGEPAELGEDGDVELDA